MKRILFVMSILASLTLWAEEVGVHRFATYNVRYVNAKNGDTGEQLWANRRTYVVKTVVNYDFDVVGMQEVTGNNKDAETGKSQLQDLQEMLTAYDSYAVEREGKQYEYNAIFYKKSKYSVLDKGYFYVNEHPESPGAGWGTSDLPRSCLWLHLQVKNTGQDFYFVCTHANYGPNLSAICGAKLIGQRVKEIAGNKPVVLVGDFNMIRDSHEEAYRGYASHLYDLALTTPVNECMPADGPQITVTTTGWSPAVNHPAGQEYDYIFYDAMEPLSRHIITEYYPEYNRTVNPSDHYPVMGRFRLQSAERPTSFKATDEASLAIALAAATPDDTVLITKGTIVCNQSVIPAVSMTISGGWNEEFTEQTGYTCLRAEGWNGPLISVPHYYNLTLDHIELSGASNTAVTGGGAIYSFGPDLRLFHCLIHDNTASNVGGAIVHKGEMAYISGCVFENNSGSVGGALWLHERDNITIHDSRFVANHANTAGGAVELQGFAVLDLQRTAFVANTATTHGALDIVPNETPSAVHVLNCSFLDNYLTAKKGLASVTKNYGGAAIWADMKAVSVPINIGLSTFMGNHIAFNGLTANFTGAAIAVFHGKMCLMDNIILANEQIIEGSNPVWKDIYTEPNEVNLWRNTYNLTSSSPEINGWEMDITNAFGGSLANGIYMPDTNYEGTYPVYQKTLANYNIACLPTTQRLCESAFTYDLNGDGVISGYVTRDQLNRPRNLQSCIGAVENTGTQGIENGHIQPSFPAGAIYSVSGQYLGTDINALPKGIYIMNGHKIIY